MKNKDEIQEMVLTLNANQPWNHNYKLPGGVETRPGAQDSHGKNIIKLKRLEPLFDVIDLKGRNVLDVGCNEGFFSLHMASKGANVRGLDIDQYRIEKARYIKSLLGEGKEIRFEQLDIYSSEFKELPRFDLCLCLGFIHRIPDPFTAMAALGDHSDMIIFEWKALKFGPHNEPFAYFSPKPVDEKNYYGTEYWLLSYAAVERILQRVGFQYFHRIDDPAQRRAILVAGKQHHPVFDRADVIKHRGRFRSMLSHMKRCINTFIGVVSGRINA